MVVMEEVCICRPWHSDASGLYLSAMTMVVMQEVYLSVAIHVVFLLAMTLVIIQVIYLSGMTRSRTSCLYLLAMTE